MLEMIGGPDRDRTDDLFHAMEARSQTAPQAHELKECNFSILAAAPEFVNPLRALGIPLGRGQARMQGCSINRAAASFPPEPQSEFSSHQHPCYSRNDQR